MNSSFLLSDDNNPDNTTCDQQFNINIEYNKCKSSVVYLDNNATTTIYKESIEEWLKWVNRGNPSSDYCSANMCKDIIKNFKQYIAKICEFTLDESEGSSDNVADLDNYRVIITSCASESNNTIIRSIVESYNFYVGGKPHIITSSIEHKSLLDCVKHLRDFGIIELTIVPPNKFGVISPESIKKAIRENTALITIMSANNETGAINDIKTIGNIAHTTLKVFGEQYPADPDDFTYKSIPFHTDAVQTFGKFPTKAVDNNVDAFSISFHKLHGPQGIGALVIRSAVYFGYKLSACISGSQNCGFRGGTENIANIAASYKSMQIVLSDRLNKNNHLINLKHYLIRGLSANIPCRTYQEYLDNPHKTIFEIIVISTCQGIYLPSTLMISVVKKTKSGKDVCNSEIKHELYKKNIIISIGSACNTNNNKASHVLYAMNADEFIRKGALRISLDDNTTSDDINYFIYHFIKIISRYQDTKYL